MRVKTGVVRRKRHKKILKAAKGYRLTYSKLYRRAHEAFLHAGQYAYVGRKQRKRQMRQLWIMRINAALRQLGFTYKDYVNKSKAAEVALDRKILADLAVTEPKTFESVVDFVMGGGTKSA